MFALFPWPDHAQKLNDYFSSKHTNMNFSLEKEEFGHLPSLVIVFFFIKMRSLQLMFIEKECSKILSSLCINIQN